MTNAELTAAIREHRQRIKQLAAEEAEYVCECCHRRPGTDLHEVFIRRGAYPRKRQIEHVFQRWNCTLVCESCHRHDMGQQPPAESPEFKRQFARQMQEMGYAIPDLPETRPFLSAGTKNAQAIELMLRAEDAD